MSLFSKSDEPAPKKEEPATEGPLTEKQKDLVQGSWEKCVPIAETAAELFYGRLFEIAPEVKPLFKESDMKEQGKKLMQMIGVAVKGLDTLGELVPAVQKLGERHGDYGVEEAHYDKVGEALLWTLGKGLGEDFTDECKEAWTITYTTLASVMKEAQGFGKA